MLAGVSQFYSYIASIKKVVEDNVLTSRGVPQQATRHLCNSCATSKIYDLDIPVLL